MSQGLPTSYATKTRVAYLLIEGNKQEYAGQQVGVSRVTINRWVNHDPEFKAIMAEIRAGITRAAEHRMVGLADTAVKTLADVCENGTTDAARVAAAKEILARLTPIDDAATMPINPRELLGGDVYEAVTNAIAEAITDAAHADT